MQRLGLGYEEVRKVRPDIIYVEAPMQGTWGPHASFRGYGVTISALAGIHYLTALPGREPVGTGTNYPDHVPNCLHMALAILMALLHRSRTGEGQYIEISQFESTVAVIGPAVMDYAVNGRVVQPTGNKVSYACPHGAYPCKGEDRWCVIAVFDPVQWRSLCEAMGRPELEADPRFATLVARKEHEAELDQIISDWTRARTREEVFWTLQRAGVPVGMVNDAADLLNRDVQLAAREHWVFLDHPEMGRCVYDAPPYRSERLNPRPLRPAPLVGQDNEYVFKQLLGLSDDEYNSYLEQGIFE
jgi:benzylsuccinate CoA-transferase BbsF subunit